MPPRSALASARAAELLESERGAWLLAAVGVLVLALSVVAALVSMPAGAASILLTAAIAAVGLLAALARLPFPVWLSAISTVACIAAVGVYAGTTYAATPTVVWLFAYVVPVIGLARGPMLGALAGFVAAPVLHLVETGVLVEPLDPQLPFGVLILVALGAAPGHLMAVARDRRAALDAELTRAVGLLEETERAKEAERLANDQSVFMLARAAEARDGTTGVHIHHVRDLAAELASAAGLDPEQARHVGWSAMLHDVGKLRVPDRILLKPGRLDDEEWDVIRQHAAWGAELLEGSPHFAMARAIARWHHENWNGTGYPDRIGGERIPFEARIVRVVDVYDALRSERPYKPAWSEAEALEELRRMREVELDPELLDLFLKLRGA